MKFVSIGAAVQDVFLSDSSALDPVKEEDGAYYAELSMGGKADVDQIHFSTGGGATNAAVTFARQGRDSVFMGVIGHDPAGRAVVEDLKQEGIEAKLTYSETYNTGYSVVLLAANGERTILTYRGASEHLKPSQFDQAVIDDADWLYVSSLAGSYETLHHVMKHAHAKSVKVAWNPGKEELKHPNKLKELLPFTEILIANKQEIQMITTGETLQQLALEAAKLVPVVVVSDGPNGVGATDRKNYVEAGIYEDVPVIDRTGAGDAFGSGFVATWADSQSLARAVTFASANSTAVVGKIGSKAGILNKNAHIHDMQMEEKQL